MSTGMPRRGQGWGGNSSPFENESRKGLLDDYSDHDEGDDKLARTQAEVDGLVGIMRDNVGKVLDRSAKLDDLEDKSGSRSLARVGARVAAHRAHG